MVERPRLDALNPIQLAAGNVGAGAGQLLLRALRILGISTAHATLAYVAGVLAATVLR
jgi:hypothetical protein